MRAALLLVSPTRVLPPRSDRQRWAAGEVRVKRLTLRKVFKMVNKATFLRVALVLALLNAGSPADLMAGLPLCGMKGNCSCESPVCARPDDYCSKWFPCVTDRPGCRRCDDHCSKGIPCLPCLPQTHRCNDYCRKCSPPLCSIRMNCPGCSSSCCDAEGCGDAATFGSHR